MKQNTMHAKLEKQIEELIQGHVEELRRVALDTVNRALASSMAEPTAASKATVKGRNRREGGTGSRRAPQELAALADRLYEVVSANPGEGMRFIAGELGSTPRELHRPMSILKTEGRVQSAGERHQTRYFPRVGDSA
ncbi:MAG: winged helix-turn-helix domain-containing protein [Myxococcota bacterium]